MKGSSVPAFNSYFKRGKEIMKVANYNQEWHKIFRGRVYFRKGYHMSWWEGSKLIVGNLSKANKYLNRQYNRMDRHIRKGDTDRAVAIWRTLHTRSLIWTLVLIVRKLNYLSLTVAKAQRLVVSIRKLMRIESSRLKFKRVFLEEFNHDGSYKKHRPLGVPSCEWRVIGASYEFLLANLWAHDWAKNQHACMPGKGVASAWLEILKKVAKGDVTEIIGYDLAKFFDLVYVSNIDKIMAGLPGFLPEYFRELVRQKPKISSQDVEREKERLRKTALERPFTYTVNISALLGSAMGQMRDPMRLLKDFQEKYLEAPYTSMPQGYNTSPIMCCRALQATGMLDHPNVIQYVDDGIVMNTRDSKLSLQSLKLKLRTQETGICMSDSKTERIMVDGEFLKPLKFLGCSFDGEVLRGHTRNRDLFEARDARERTRTIIERLKGAERLTDVLAYQEEHAGIRKELTGLITESWNQPASHIFKVPSRRWEGNPLVDYKSTFEDRQAKISKVDPDSIEAKMVQLMSDKAKFGEIMASTNTTTMIGSFCLLNLLSYKVRKKVRHLTPRDSKRK